MKLIVILLIFLFVSTCAYFADEPFWTSEVDYSQYWHKYDAYERLNNKDSIWQREKQ